MEARAAAAKVTRAIEDPGDVLVRDVAQLGEDERRALVFRQPGQVGQDATQLLAPVDLHAEAVASRLGHLAHRTLAPSAQQREAPVSRDAVQPWPQRLRPLRAHEVPVSERTGLPAIGQPADRCLRLPSCNGTCRRAARRTATRRHNHVRLTRRFTAATVAAVLGIGVLAPAALAGGDCCPPPPPLPEKAKCNSGSGNGSESQANTGHCTNGDPGNSFFHNRGGDGIPSSGGFSSPGGNNVD
jgi:hypothetical protein